MHLQGALEVLARVETASFSASPGSRCIFRLRHNGARRPGR
jgi:hypothetical protein